MAIILDGKAIANDMRKALKTRVDGLKEKGITPGLTVVLVGEDPASKVYVRNKAKACGELGMNSKVIRLPVDTTMDEILEIVNQVNNNPNMHGLLVQLPLPKHLDEAIILKAIDPQKDVDGFHAINKGMLFNGDEAIVSCTPIGCLELIKRTGVKIEGCEAVVVGRSNIVGKPMAMLLLNENATVTICHSRTRDLAQVTRRADILVAAIGKPNFIKGDMIKPGAIVIDVGVNRMQDGKLCGDVEFESGSSVAGYITPVPGGVGPMTITMLLANTVEVAERNA